MLELIFQGFVEWIYGMVLECWEYFASALLEVMSMDCEYLRSHIPVLAEIQQILLAVGWALLIGNLAYQAMRSMVSGVGIEAEEPGRLFLRTAMFSFLLLVSRQICDIGFGLSATVMEMLQVPDAITFEPFGEKPQCGLAYRHYRQCRDSMAAYPAVL